MKPGKAASKSPFLWKHGPADWIHAFALLRVCSLLTHYRKSFDKCLPVLDVVQRRSKALLEETHDLNLRKAPAGTQTRTRK